MKTNNVHEGHRYRMRCRIAENGINSLQTHEILEYLLYSFVPRKDTNEIAHSLINEYGSLSGVLNADRGRLTASGLSESAALFLSSLPDIFRRYSVDIESEKISLKGRDKVRDYFKKLLFGNMVELLYAAALDAQDNLIQTVLLSSGNGNSVKFSVREVVDFAIRSGASGIVLAHNHPSGSINPSESDYYLTMKLAQTLNELDVALHDHYIFGGNAYYSFDQSGLMAIIKDQNEMSAKDGSIKYV